MQRGSTNPSGRWVELLQSRVSLLSQLAHCREGCSARAPTGFEHLFLKSSAIADCIRCTSPSGWFEFAMVSTRDLLSQSTIADCQSSYSSSHEIALIIADFSAWYELLHRPVGACHRSMMSSQLMATISAPPSVVPSWVDPWVYTWMSVGPVSSMAASVAAICWSLDIDLETSVIAVGAGGGRLHGGSGLGGE